MVTAGVDLRDGHVKLYSVPSTSEGRHALYTRLVKAFPKALFGLWSGVAPVADSIAVCCEDAPAHVKRGCSAVVTVGDEEHFKVRAITNCLSPPPPPPPLPLPLSDIL